MMPKQTITLYSFYNWDNTLFDNLTLPAGIDKDKLIDNILLESGERSVIYSDPEFLKAAIGIWSRTYQETFERWIRALSIEYDPLENYDRREEWTDDLTRNATDSDRTVIDTDTSAHTTTSTTDSQTTGQTSSETETGSRVAYPDNAWHDTQKTVDSGSLNINVSGTGSGTGAETGTVDTTETRNGTETLTEGAEHEGRVHGNIGVTTSQQMLQAELDLGYWNIIVKITDLFIENFIIMIY